MRHWYMLSYLPMNYHAVLRPVWVLPIVYAFGVKTPIYVPKIGLIGLYVVVLGPT